jgi:hypothetical protein
MRCFFLMISFYIGCFEGFSQNLVPNPDFVQYTTCPYGLGELDSCLYWHSPSVASPDYFNVCHDTLSGTNHDVGVPVNVFGSQPSLSNSYIGIATWAISPPNYREYAEVDLPALEIGARYRVLLRVSLGDNSSYATAAPSVFFYKDGNVYQTTNKELPFTPQISFTPDHITDKVNWVTISDTFTADSAFKHMIIGNFNDDVNTTRSPLPSGSPTTYYYIDSVAVEKIADPSYVTENEYAPSGFSLSPNPSNGTFTVQLPEGSTALATITDVAGRTICTHVVSHNTPINTALPPGIYLLHLTTPTGTWRSKLVIQ